MANQSPYAKPARMLYAVVPSETIAEISTVPTGTVIMSVWEVNWQYMASFI